MARIPSPGIVPVFSTAASDITGSPVVDGALRAAVDTAALYVGIAGSWVAISGGGGGGVSGSGTAGNITKWVGATAVGDSILSESLGAIQLLHPTNAKLNLTSTNGVDQLALINTPTQKTLASLTTFEVFCGEVFQLNALEGARAPLLTIGQRDALTPDAGRFIYNTTSNVLQYWNGSAWIDAAGGGGGGGNVAVTTPTTANKIVTWLDTAGNVTSTSSWDIQGNVLSNLNDGSRFDMLHTNIQSGSGQTVLTHAGAGTFEINSNNAIIVDATGFSYTFAGSDVERFNLSQLYSLQLPSITTTARDAGSPLSGDAIFNTTANEVQYYDGTSWVSVSGGGGGGNVAVTTPTTAGCVATWNDAAGALTSSTAWSISGNSLSNGTALATVTTGSTSLYDDGVNGYIDYQGGGDFILHSEDAIQLDALGPITAGSLVTGISFANAAGPFHPPELTSTQRDALTPSTGDIIVNTTTLNLEAYIEDSWVQLNNTGANVFVTTPTTAGRLATWNTTSGGLTNAAAWSITGNTLANTVGGTGALNIGGNINISALANSATIAGTQPTGSLSITGANSISMTANSSLSLSSTTNNVSLSAPAAGRVSAAFSAGPFVPPKMTTTARDALTAVSGDQIYNTTTNKLQWYSGSAWIDAEGGGGAGNVTVTTPTTAGRIASWNDAAGDLTASTAWTISGSDIASVPAAADASIQVGNTTLTYVHVNEQTTLDAQGFDFENISRYYINTAPDGMFFQSLDQIAFSGNDFTFSTGGPAKFTITSTAVTVNLALGNDLRINNLTGGVGTVMSIDPAASNKVRVSSLKERALGSFEIFNNTGTQLNLTHVAGVDGLLLISTPVAKVVSSPTELELSANNEIILGGDKGVRFPSLTTTQRDALTPVAGTQIFNSTVSKIQWYSGSAWIDAEGGGGGGNVNTTLATTANRLPYWTDAAGTLSNGSTGPFVSGSGSRMAIGDEDFQALFTVANGAVPTYPFSDVITAVVDTTVAPVGPPTLSINVKQFDPTNGRLGYDMLANMDASITFGTVANFDNGEAQLVYNSPAGQSGLYFIAGGPVVVGNNSAEPSDALFSVGGNSASTQGYFYPALMDTTGRDSLTPAAGAQCYNTTTNRLQWYDGSGWVDAFPGAGGGNVTTTTPTVAGNIATWNNTVGDLTASSNFSISGNILSNPNTGSTVQLQNLRIEGNPLAMVIAAEGGALSQLNLNSDDTIRFDADSFVFSGAKTERVDMQNIYSIQLPALTTTQRDAQSGVVHDFIYNDTVTKPQYNTGSNWETVGNVHVPNNDVTTANAIATWNSIDRDLTTSTAFTISGNTLENTNAISRVQLDQLRIEGNPLAMYIAAEGGPLSTLNINSDDTIRFDAVDYIFSGTSVEHADFQAIYSIRLPGLTTTQRDAQTGVLHDFIYNDTLGALQFNNGSSWITLAEAGAGGGNVSTTLPTTANRLTWWSDAAGALVNNSNWQVGTFGTQDLANTTTSARITIGASSNIRNSSGTLYIEGGDGLTLDSNNGMLLTSLAGNVTLNANTQGVNLNGNTINLSAGIPNQINITTTTTTFDPGSGNNIVFNNIPVGTGDTLVLNGSNQLRRSTGGGSGNVTVTTPTTAGRLASWNDAAGDLTASTSFTLSGNTLSNAAANARVELGTSTALFNDGSTNLQNFSGAGDLLLFSNNAAAISTNGGGIFLTAAGRLNASGTTEPFIPPRLTTTARDALTALPGDTIYNTTASKMQWYDGSAWVDAQGSVTTTTPTTANRIATWNNTAGDLTASTGWQISGSALTSTPTLADASFAVGDTSFTYDNTGEFTTLSTNSKDLFVNVREMYLNPSDYFSVQSFGDIFLSTGTGLKLSGINVGTGDTLVLDAGSGNVVRRVTSSRRYKEDIVDYDGMTDLSARLQPRNFRYIGDDKVQIGLIAEEVVEVLPEIVTRDAEGLPNGVDYARLCVALLGELRELHARIARLEEGVNFHG